MRVEHKLGLALSVFGGAVLHATSAQALDIVNGGTISAGAVAVAAIVVAVVIYVNARKREKAESEKIAALTADKVGLGALLSSAPGACMGWTIDGTEVRSEGVSAVFGFQSGSVASFDALMQHLEDVSESRLRDSVAKLRADGAAFGTDLDHADGQHIVHAEGSTMRDPSGGVLGHVVWFRDVSRNRGRYKTLQSDFETSARDLQRFTELVDGLPIPMWRRGPDLRLRWCNEAYAAMFESDRDALIGQGGRELVSGHDPEQAVRLAERAQTSGELQMEQRFFVVGGERRAFDVIEAPSGESGAIVGIARDVTDRENARAELVRHLDAHIEVLQNVNTAIAIFGPDKLLQVYNRAYADLWQIDEDWLDAEPHYAEVLEMQRDNRRLPEQADFTAYKRSRLELFSTIIDPYEELMHLPDGTALRLSITPHPFGGLVFMYEDVTNQLDLERAHRTLIAVQQASLDNLYEGVAVYGSDGKLQLYNPAFAKIWHLSDDMLTGEPHISEVIAATRDLFDEGDDWQDVEDRIMSVWIERQARSGRIDRPDGTVIDFASVPLPDGALLFTYLDVTDSTRIERALRERNEALQAADQLKSEFIANVSYELRTPLNTIIGFAEILANQYFGRLNDRQLEYSQGILDSSHQLLLLINDILDLATIEAGHMVLEQAPFDLHATMTGIMALGKERAKQQGIELVLECPTAIGTINADERRIKQVLFNLLSNAIKFTPDGGRIVVGAERENGELRLWVSDTGVGIPDEERALIFEKFHKGAGSERHPGAGLGLSLVQNFVEMHGGRVELESDASHGSRFICHIPIENAQTAGEADAAAAGD